MPAAARFVLLALVASFAGGIVVHSRPAFASEPGDTVSLAVAAREAVVRVAGSPLVASASGVFAAGNDAAGDDWDWVDQARPPARSSGDEKSLLRAVTASALLPGLGEQYIGRTRRAKIFQAVEAAIWGTFLFYRIQGEMRQDSQIEFANLNAGAPTNQDSDYYEHIGLWLSLDEWHDIVRRDARLHVTDDPVEAEAFFERHKRYDEGEAWFWESDDDRIRYRRLRSRAEWSFRNSRLAVGAAMFNRLASVADALALTRRHNSRVRTQSASARLDVRIGPLALGDAIVVGPVVTARY